MNARPGLNRLTGYAMCAALAGMALPALSLPPTDADVAAAIAGGQQYLLGTFHDNGDGTGYWVDYDNVTGTATAVAALIESGKLSDPVYKAAIDKGIAYLRSQAKPNGGIYVSSDVSTYETGLSLTALGLYGQATSQDAAYKAVVQKAVDFLKSYQNIEGSTAGGDYGPNGEATSTHGTACASNASEWYGGWSYDPASGNYDKCRLEADLSNTQFAVMGLWYGSRYLGLPIANAPWANALLKFLQHRQSPDGGFYVYSGGYYKGVAATGGGLWCLAMIGQTDAKQAATDAGTMVQRAVAWYDANYTWNYSNAYLYAIYGMSKGLTATIGPAAKVGAARDWAADMKTEVIGSGFRTHADASGTTPATDSWYSGAGLDPERAAQTSWVLMSLAFASTTTKSTEKILAQPPAGSPGEIDNPVKGIVTLNTDGVATISAADRGKIAQATWPEWLKLPIGAFTFTLNDVANGASTVLKITPPAGAFDKNNPDSFVAADGTLKPGLRWYKVSNGAWVAVDSVNVTADLAQGVLLVTLKDGGPEDANPAAGVIGDPGAPGVGAAPAAAEDNSSGCTIGNGRGLFDPLLPLLAIGAVAYLLQRRVRRRA